MCVFVEKVCECVQISSGEVCGLRRKVNRMAVVLMVVTACDADVWVQSFCVYGLLFTAISMLSFV